MSLLVDLFMALSRSIDLVDPRIGNHNRRVAYIAGCLAESIGLNPNEITNTVIAAGLHDIGALKENEYKELIELDYKGGVDNHSTIGYQLLNSCAMTQRIAHLVKFHHVDYSEKNTFQSGEIPLASEIIHIADRIDVSVRYHDDVLEQKNKILKMIQEYSKIKFNPELVKHFILLANKDSFWFDLQHTLIEKKIKDLIFFNPLLSLEQIHDISKLFTKVIDFRSRFTATHSTSVSVIAKELGRLLNFSPRECMMLDISGHLHDIGKLAIPLTILHKPEKLTQAEWRKMKQHAYFTYMILTEIDDYLFKVITEWASYHHETIDGDGYPFKIPANKLTVGSRILAVADMFTALAESRPYRCSMDDDIIKEEMKKVKGQKLDPLIVDVLIQNYDEFKKIRTEAFCDAMKNFSLLFDTI